MKKITKKDLFNYITEQAQNLYKIEILKEEKFKIESDLKLLDEGKKVNPLAVCNSSTGKKKTKKFEKCVMDVKKKEGIEEDKNPSKGITKKEKLKDVKKEKSITKKK